MFARTPGSAAGSKTSRSARPRTQLPAQNSVASARSRKAVRREAGAVVFIRGLESRSSGRVSYTERGRENPMKTRRALAASLWLGVLPPGFCEDACRPEPGEVSTGCMLELVDALRKSLISGLTSPGLASGLIDPDIY